jgi:uncharacterized repeat protein (TIGR04138 family)
MPAPLKLSGKKKYHPQAYEFVFDALRFTQEKLQRNALEDMENEESHISGEELLNGIQELAKQQFGWLAHTVFTQWNVTSTDDFGYIVFDLIEKGKMRKTDHDRLTDFFDVYNFEQVLERDYVFDVNKAFKV